jgi:hypothetical protein
MKNVLIIGSLSLCLQAGFGATAFATPAEDIQTIRGLIPSGFDIAQYQAAKIKDSKSDSDAEKAVAANYMFRDFSASGHRDLMVIIEKNPTFADLNNKPCTFDPLRDFKSDAETVASLIAKTSPTSPLAFNESAEDIMLFLSSSVQCQLGTPKRACPSGSLKKTPILNGLGSCGLRDRAF